MARLWRSLGTLVAVLAATAASPAVACGPTTACSVDSGSYHAAVPATWDGRSPLPALIFFHGYGSSGTAVAGNQALVRAMERLGVLLIAPNGVQRSWAHVGSPSSARNEIAFLDVLLSDIRRRWPIDDSRLWASGFSQGGSMAWDAACYRGSAFAGFAPIAGAFWRPLPDTCPDGPVRLRHIHGTTDQVVPMQGRQIAGRFRQGDVLAGMAVWRQVNGCAASPDRTEDVAGLRCRIWDTCSSGQPLQLCLHDGGHSIRTEWLEAAIVWLQGS